MPYFELKDLNGKVVKSSEYQGKVILINFWATWCPPCKREIPDFIDLYKKYQKEDFVILGIALDDIKSVVDFKSAYKINYPILIGDQEVVRKYGNIRGIPTSFLIGKDGKIKQRYDGYRTREIFEKDILKELK
ncbi:MAG: Thioredoxin [Ignavibacteriae bacterium]|nr:MAG: Thioredoxin [Ignavibacteriota bacterium]